MHGRGIGLLALACASLITTACGGGGEAPEDASAGMDGGPERCRSDLGCDDGLYCNGLERCAPASPDADARGCLAAESGPCADGEACDESTDRCRLDCPVTPDADGDGHLAPECGGDDCDDADPNRFPGNVEICDAAGRDEDCDPTTLGPDRDGDGYVGIECCNMQPDGGSVCGEDCDDLRATINPSAIESCNLVDEDCDGSVDEGVEGCCEAGETRACGEPLDGGGFSDVGACEVGTQRCIEGSWGSCVGGVSARPEFCNGIDDDCDGEIGEAPFVCEPEPETDGEACTTSCGTPGRQVCRNDCMGFDACRAPDGQDVCNGCDDDVDGEVDEDAAGVDPADRCAVGDVESCTTICGTTGSRVCESTCAWGPCRGFTETCNYCDDNALDGIDDEAFVDAFDQTWRFLPCGACPSDWDPVDLVSGTSFSHLVDGGISDRGAAWSSQAVVVGHGGFVLDALLTVSSRDGAGLSLVFTTDEPLGMVGGTGAQLGVPYGLHGYAYEWIYDSSGDDLIRLRELTGGATGNVVETWSNGSLDTALKAAPPRLRLHVEYVPVNNLAGEPGKLTLIIFFDDGSEGFVNQIFPVTAIEAPDFEPGEPLWIGVTAATTTTRTSSVRVRQLDVVADSVCYPRNGLRIVSPDDDTTRGRLEIYRNGEWGSICSDGFDDDAAEVACRQMGFSSGTTLPSFGGGSGPIWLDDLDCSALPTYLWNCKRSDWGVHDCDHSQDVGVDCVL